MSHKPYPSCAEDIFIVFGKKDAHLKLRKEHRSVYGQMRRYIARQYTQKTSGYFLYHENNKDVGGPFIVLCPSPIPNSIFVGGNDEKITAFGQKLEGKYEGGAGFIKLYPTSVSDARIVHYQNTIRGFLSTIKTMSRGDGVQIITPKIAQELEQKEKAEKDRKQRLSRYRKYVSTGKTILRSVNSGSITEAYCFVMATSKAILSNPSQENMCILLGRKLSPLRSMADVMGKQLKKSGFKEPIGLLGQVSVRPDPQAPNKKQMVFYFSQKPRAFNKMFEADMRKLLLRISTTWVIPLLRNVFVTFSELKEIDTTNADSETSEDEGEAAVAFFNSLVQDEGIKFSDTERKEINRLVIETKLSNQLASTMGRLKKF